MKHFFCFFLLTLACSSFGFSAVGAHDFLPDAPDDFKDSLPPDVTTDLPLQGVPLGVANSVIDTYKLWDAGDTLNVCFQGGTTEVRAFFVQESKIWDDAASINFDFGAAPAYRTCQTADNSHIRVAFANNGNWSYVGTDALSIDKTKPTLNVVAPANLQPASRQFGGTILHELGHALALLHEHQSPESNCSEQFNWDMIYTSLGAPPNGWDKQKVDQNLRPLVESPRYRTTAYDRKSIMHYSLPREWFLSSSAGCIVPRNDKPSATDMTTIAESYPATTTQQDLYFERLDQNAADVLRSLNLSPDQINSIEQVIDRSVSAVPGRNFETNLPAMVIQSGACSTANSGGVSTQNCTFNQ